MKTDTLTVSRVYRIITEHGVDDLPAGEEQSKMLSILLASRDSQIVYDILEILDKEPSEKMIDNIQYVSKFFDSVYFQIQQYNAEIDKRKKYAIEVLKMYALDEEPKKPEQNYPADFYLSCYKTLAQAGINPCNLNIYESFLLAEEISCASIIKSVYEMLSMIEDKQITFAKNIKEFAKHANFLDFVLDIYNNVENVYNEVTAKEKSKK